MEKFIKPKPCMILYKMEKFPDYAITKNGEVFSFITKRLLKPYITNVGYMAVAIRGENFHFRYIHRMLAETFIPNSNPELYTEVNHIDGNKLNNNLENLEWVTGCKNIRHAFAHDLCKEKALLDYNLLDELVQRLLTEPELNYSNLSRELDISDPSSLRKLIVRHLKRENRHEDLDNLSIAIKKKGTTHKKIKLTFDDGTVEICFSGREAANLLGTQPSTISQAISGKRSIRGVKVEHIQ